MVESVLNYKQYIATVAIVSTIHQLDEHQHRERERDREREREGYRHSALADGISAPASSAPAPTN